MKNPQTRNVAQQREYPEPDERASPVPWLLGLIAASLMVWGVAYFLMEPLLVPPSQQTAGAAPGQTSTVAAAANGTQIYASQCANCHQASGAGMPGVFPPLGGSGFVTGEPGRLVNILLRGISGSLTVGGKEYSSTMPPFASKLSDAEIAAVATHIRGNFGNKAGDPITADFVKEQRANAPNVPYAGDKDLQEHP